MRLIRCHIENFGGLSDVSLEFRQGCHIICEKNGWGKSTLAAFIRVMLFGFSEEKSRDELKNERKRFRPWQGGIYGGQLEFETGGKVYCISRTFGSKEKEDAFSLREKATNLESGRFSSAVGEELFMLDESSFCRTVFISQNDCETYTTDGISAKIGNLAEDTEDINNYEKVDGRLAELLNKLSPRRATGMLCKMKNDIAVMEEKVRGKEALEKSLESVGAALSEKTARQAELKEEQVRLTKRQQELGIYKDRQARREKYADLCRAYEERKRQAEEAAAAFPGRLPKDEEIRTHIGLCSELSAANEKVSGSRLSEEQRKRLETLAVEFQDGTPDEEALRAWETEIRQYEELKQEAEKERLSPEETEKLRRCEEQFGGAVPAPEILEEAVENWESCREKKVRLREKLTALDMLERSYEEKAAEQRKKRRTRARISLLLLLAGALLLLATVLCALPAQNAAAGGLAGLLGIAALIAGVRTAFSAKEEDASDKLEPLRREAEEWEEEIRGMESATADFLAEYGVDYEEERVLETLYELKRQRQEYQTLQEKAEKAEERNYSARLRIGEERIRNFLAPYFSFKAPGEEGFAEAARELRERLKEYEKLREQDALFRQALREREDIRGRINSFIEGLSMEPQADAQAQLLELQSRLQTVLERTAELEKAAGQKKDFEERENTEELCEIPPADGEDLETVSRRLLEIGEELETERGYAEDYRRRMEELREGADRLEEEENRLKDTRARYEAGTRRYELIKTTRELLAQAKTAFTAKYTEPLRAGFQKYYKLLTGENGENYYMDANHTLTVEEKGMQRDTRFFSAGYRDLIGVCMRMALVDAMYPEEKPFIIFDDPFANLDGEKVEGALALLRSISEEYQVLYFTCHESRAREWQKISG